MFIANKRWPEVKALLKTGSQGYYIDRDGWVNVTLPGEMIDCEFPRADEFDALEPEFQRVYSRDWAAEFDMDFKANLVRSDLSTAP